MTNTNNLNTNSLPNQINADSLYGLQGSTECLQGDCHPNTIDTGSYVPSLQEIAAYNTSAPNIAEISSESIQQNGNQITATDIEQINPSQTIQSTPATTFNYGATMSTNMRQDLGMGITDFANPYPVTPESIQYLNGFIRTQIGRRLTIDFLVGANTIVSKTGYLLGVASNYILINELDTNDLTTCDFYNIKFIRFYY